MTFWSKIAYLMLKLDFKQYFSMKSTSTRGFEIHADVLPWATAGLAVNFKSATIEGRWLWALFVLMRGGTCHKFSQLLKWMIIFIWTLFFTMIWIINYKHRILGLQYAVYSLCLSALKARVSPKLKLEFKIDVQFGARILRTSVLPIFARVCLIS